MATHIPAETGAGRAYLDPDVMKKRGISGLYTSNSKGTAEGYTYGEGYVVKAKKPFDKKFSDAIICTMLKLCKEIEGCVFGYNFLDEILYWILYQK